MAAPADENTVRVDRLDLAEPLDYVATDVQDGLVDVPSETVESHRRLSAALRE